MLDKISGDIMLSWGVKRFFIAFIAGALANFALPPFDFFAVLFISFPILVWLIDGASKQGRYVRLALHAAFRHVKY